MTRLVFDIEGDGLYDTITKVWCVVTKDIDTGEICSYGPNNIHGALAKLDTTSLIIGHNILDFDLPALSKLYGWSRPNDCMVVDTLVLSRLLNPDRKGLRAPHSLAEWGQRVGFKKPEHEDWSQYSEEMLGRCKADVEINERVYKRLLQEMEGHDWFESIRIEYRVAEIISNQSKAGVQFNSNAAKDCVQELSEWIQAVDNKLDYLLPVIWKQYGVSITKPFLKSGKPSKQVIDWLADSSAHVGGPFTRVNSIKLNLNSDKQVKELLMSHGWQPISWNYDKQGVRSSPKLEFSEDDSDGIESDLGNLIKRRKILSHRRSQIRGWINSVRPDGTVTANANSLGTNTGRMRHSVVVNVPKAGYDKQGNELAFYGNNMRALFTHRPGRVLVGYDASGLELRMLAHYMNDHEFTERLLHGDIHTYNQGLAGLPTRDSAKTFIYAFNYGAGDEKLGTIIAGTAAEGRKLRRRFLESCPSLEKLINGVKRASGRGYLIGLDGRKLWMRKNDRGDVQKNKALNTLLQGGGAIVMKQAMIYLDDWVKEHNLDAIKIIDMHDEAQWDVIPNHVEQFQELAALSVVKAGEYFRLNIPLAAESKVGNNWAETH